MNKKVLIGVTIAIIVVIGGIVGISKYTNTPDYVMKQYVDGVNNKNQRKIERILYTANQFKIIGMDEAYERSRAFEIVECKKGLMITDSEPVKDFISLYYEHPEKIDVPITEIAHYTIYNKDKLPCVITLGDVNGKWKVIKCPFFLSE